VVDESVASGELGKRAIVLNGVTVSPRGDLVFAQSKWLLPPVTIRRFAWYSALAARRGAETTRQHERDDGRGDGLDDGRDEVESPIDRE
jgi:hypothetical protein